MADIPLAQVQVIWDNPGEGERKIMPPLKLMTIGDKDDPRYDCSWGACNMDFNQADDAGRLLMLFQQFLQLVLMYGIDAEDVHEAFLQIPEYRKALPYDLLPERYRDEE